MRGEKFDDLSLAFVKQNSKKYSVLCCRVNELPCLSRCDANTHCKRKRLSVTKLKVGDYYRRCVL